MKIKHQLRKYLWQLGYDISKFDPAYHPVALKRKLLECNTIDTVLDVGANSGQFAMELRGDLAYKNRIVSFEPLSLAYSALMKNSMRDDKWEIYNYALGNVEEELNINISENSLSSSFLEMLPAHTNSAPDSKVIGQEVIEIKTLDSIFSTVCTKENKIFLKIDTQGYESNVLQGAKYSLEKIDIVQLEMSVVPMYEGEKLFHEMSKCMANLGFSLIAIEPVFSDPETGRLLQLDGIFQR